MNIVQKRKNKWFEQLLKSYYIGILVVNKERKILFVNQTICKMFGYTQSELLGHTAEMLHVNYKSYVEFAKLAFNFVINGKPVDTEYQCKRKDGTLFWVHVVGEVVKEHNDVIWTMVDITKQKQNEEKIKKLSERAEFAIEANRDVIWDWNLVDNSLYVSDKWKEIIGHDSYETPYEIKIWQKHLHPEDRKRLFKEINDNIKGKTDYLDTIYRIKHDNGSWIWIQLKGKTHYDENGNAVRMTGTHRNITLKRELELKIIQQSQIIEQIHDSVIVTDLDGYIKSYNRGSENILGYKNNEVIGEHITIIYPKDEYSVVFNNIKKVMLDGDRHDEVHLVKKSGDIIDADLSMSLFRNRDGKVEGIVYYAQDITEKKLAFKDLLKQKEKLKYQAQHDALTDLPNRVLFYDRLTQGIEKAKRDSTKLALLFLDLDHFKEINDSLGHDVGDGVLKSVTKSLSGIIRKEDTLARLGGDEFTIVLNGLKDAQDASRLARKIIDVLSEPIFVDGNELYMSTSVGISLYPDDGDSLKDLLKYADAAMYKAKSEGRNNFQFYSSEMTKLAFERVVMESSIRAALKNGDFMVYYQPQIDALTNKLVGMEALVRWRHPVMGVVLPIKFIELAELSGLIVDIDRFVIKNAIREMIRWRNMGLDCGVLAMNLSVKQLKQKDFVHMLKSILQENKCKAEWIELEVTESQIMSDPKNGIKMLKEINALGVGISIDDFGTGYSSLAYLRKLPINKLKIDKSFIDDLPYNDEDSTITKTVIALAKSLNLKVIAEGVETKEQKDFIVQHGCSDIQGYYYSKPLNAVDMEIFLKDIAKRG